MKTISVLQIAAASVALASIALFLAGCEVDGTDSVTRNVGVDFTGFYDSTATNADFVSPANTGNRCTSLNLTQSGDVLQAIDNNSIIFRGTLGSVISDSGAATASFTLTGSTTAGESVTIAGSLSGQGTTATMSGTWIEPNIYAYVNGDATINPIATNSPTPVTNTAVTVTAAATTLAKNASTTVSATGGSGNYNWTVSNSNLGNVAPSNNASTTYTATNISGVNRVTATDASNASLSGYVDITTE